MDKYFEWCRAANNLEYSFLTWFIFVICVFIASFIIVKTVEIKEKIDKVDELEEEIKELKGQKKKGKK